MIKIQDTVQWSRIENTDPIHNVVPPIGFQIPLAPWVLSLAPPLLVGLQAGTTTLEISLVVTQKIGHNTT